MISRAVLTGTLWACKVARLDWNEGMKMRLATLYFVAPFSCCADVDFVGPSTCKVARLDGNEGMKMRLATLYFVAPSAFPFIFCFCFSLLTFLSCFIFLFLKAATNQHYSSQV